MRNKLKDERGDHNLILSNEHLNQDICLKYKRIYKVTIKIEKLRERMLITIYHIAN